MRIVIILFFLTFVSLQADAQEKFYGDYYNCFGGELKLNSDSTFNYIFRFDLEYGWAKGRWRIRNDTIYFTTILVWDTIRYKDDKTNVLLDSLFLSVNQTSNLNFDSFTIYKEGKPESISVQNTKCQNTYPVDKKLYYRRKKLFRIKENGKLIRKKEMAIWPSKRRIFGYKRYPTWYIRRED